MTTYSVAEARARLPQLINSAVAGEAVVITRHGKPVAEIRPAQRVEPGDPAARAAAFDRLIAHRVTPSRPSPTSVELLDMIYDEPAV